MSASKKNQQTLDTGFKQQILNIGSIGVLITAVSDGTILYANKVIARLLGIKDADSIIGTPVPNFYWDPKDRQIVQEHVRTEGSVKDHEVRIRQSNGNMIWVSISIQSFDLEGEQVLLLEIADITVRKQAEEAIKAEQQRAQTILEAVTVPMIISRLSDSKVLYANQALAQVGNIDLEKLVRGRTVDYFASPDDRDKVAELLRQYGHVSDFETQLVRGDGSLYWVLLSARIINFQNDTCVLSSYVDITRHKQAEQALRDSEERYSAVVNQANDGVIIIQDNVAQFVNIVLANMLGYTQEEVQGTPFINYVAPESRALIAGRVKARLAGEDVPSVYEARLTRKDGTVMDAELSAGVIQYRGRLADVGMIRDITGRKQIDAALKESEERFRAIYDNATIGLYRTSPDGQLLMINPAGIRMMGYDSFDEIVKLNVENAGYAQEGARSEFREKIEREGYVTGLENKWKRKDGSTIFVRESAKAIRDENGKVLYYDGSFEDITERKQVEQAATGQRAFLQRVIDADPNFIFVKDREGRFVLVNKALADAYGSTPEGLLGKSDADFNPNKEEVEHFHKDDLEVIDNLQEKFVPEELITTATGESRWLQTVKRPLIEADGSATSLLGVATDITARKQAEAARRESQRLLQLVMDNIPQAVFWKDKNLTYLGTNQAFAEDAGFASPQEIVGRDDFDMPWKEQAELYRADDQRVLDFGETKLNYEEPQTGPTGKVTWLRTSKIPMQDVDGKIFAVLGMYEDITEWKQLQRQVQEAFERRGYQVQVITEISQEVASASEISDLFDRVVTLTKERLGYYHTQLLRYDPAQDAVVLVNGYGETGQKMLAGGHKLPMGTGLIGTAAASGQTILRSTLAEDPDWRPNPLLPNTQGEIAVPIKWQDTVLGVLDVQSNQAGILTEDDRLLLEGLCGQVAVAIEQTRLRQEMAERLEEVNRLYQSMSHEGWKTYRETADLPAGFMFDQAGIKPVDEAVLADELFANIPMKVLGGEVVGTLTVANDPRHPTSPEDHAFLQQVSDQIALALESARLFGQTQSALAQTERLSEAGLRFARSADLQELLVVLNETLGIPKICRAAIGVFEHNSAGDLDGMTIVANWWDGIGHKAAEIGMRYTLEMLQSISFFLSPDPVFINDTFNDDRLKDVKGIMEQQHVRAIAVMPLYSGTRHIGTLLLESEEMHNFTQDEIHLFSAMAPQIATVQENLRQFERAQKQAERESTLNIISQKIQSATTVEAVLQIAARELGHALGAPMTIAQLSMKDKK